jgi:hypothetical protein
MGLSNEERLSGLFYDINQMVCLGNQLKDHSEDYGYPETLVSFVGDLWDAFLGQNHNAAHWIIGSSASNPVTWGTVSSWGIAINHHCHGLMKEDSLEPEKVDFDAFDGFLDITGLLGQVRGPYKQIYEIYAYSEQAVYHLRRYEDPLLKSLSRLSKVISDIQGDCFNLFKDEDVYARAYILSNITKKLYDPLYPYQKDKWDPLTVFMDKNAIHHNLSRIIQPRDGDLKALAELDIKLHRIEKKGKLSIIDRAETMLILAGRRFHYDRIFKDLITAIKKSVTTKDIALLTKLFNECKKQHEEDEKQEQKNYQEDQYSPLSIYGLSVR